MTATRAITRFADVDDKGTGEVATADLADSAVTVAKSSGLQATSAKGAASGYASLDGNTFVPAAQLARYRVAGVAVGPSVGTEVTLIDQTIPGGLQGATGLVRCSIDGDTMMNNAGTGQTIQFRVYAGGTKIYDAVTATIGASASRRAVDIEMTFANINSQSSNELVGTFGIGTQTAPTTGISGLASPFLQAVIGSGIVAIDTSVNWNFKVTMTLGASNANIDVRVSSLLLEVL